jgi:hypothetical protein
VIEDFDVSGSDKGKRLDRPGLQKIRARCDKIAGVIRREARPLARNGLTFARSPTRPATRRAHTPLTLAAFGGRLYGVLVQ